MATAAAKTMDMFAWEGVDKSGKRVKGEMSGRNDALVKAQLRSQGVNPLKVNKEGQTAVRRVGRQDYDQGHHRLCSSTGDHDVFRRTAGTVV